MGRTEEGKRREAERKKRWTKDNPDWTREYMKEYRKNHPERYVEDPKQVEIRRKRWEKKHPEKHRANKNSVNQTRRARIQGSSGQHTGSEWLALLKFYKNTWLSCGTKENIQKDHVVPLALGGSNDLDNLQPLCKDCNRAKGIQSIDFREKGY